MRMVATEMKVSRLPPPPPLTRFTNLPPATLGVYGSDAYTFRPERFLDDPDLAHAAYGFGTRMCAGFHLANRQLYVMILRLVWAFEIKLSSKPRENKWQMRALEVSNVLLSALIECSQLCIVSGCHRAVAPRGDTAWL